MLTNGSNYFLSLGVCAKSGEYYIRDPKDCSKFIHCQGSRPTFKECPGVLVFDLALEVCNWPFAVDCGDGKILLL